MPAGGHRDDSGTPLAAKLGVRQGSRVLVLAPPDGFSLGPLPAGVETAQSARGRLDVIVLFTVRASELRRRFASLSKALEPDGRLWIAWPKKASGLPNDLTFETVQRAASTRGSSTTSRPRSTGGTRASSSSTG